jgi:TonB-linked SusC/RagA family outer membrane protein
MKNTIKTSRLWQSHYHLRMIILLLLCVFSSFIWAQSKLVQGVVNDETGSPLPGVNVVIKGTSQGTITDVNGKFKLTVPSEKSIIAFSFMGYLSQDVLVDNHSNFTITLKENVQKLGEVVVVGYGTQSRANVTTAIASLDTTSLRYKAVSNPETALQGAIPGLRVVNTSGTPGAAPNIILRGGASITAQTGPLYVVDGVVRSNINDINPDDILTMDVLKDAASCAIYGARSNNGVVLITTKQGKAGKVEVSYQYKGGVNYQRAGGIQFMNAGDYITWNRIGEMNTDICRGNPIDDPIGSATGSYTHTLLVSNGDGPNTPYPSIWNISFSPTALTGYGNVQSVTDPVTGLPIYYINHNGQTKDAAYNSSPMLQEHDVAVSGGDDKATFRTSLGFYNEDGLIKGSSYQRFTGTLDGSYKVRDNVKIYGSVDFSRSTQPTTYESDASLFYRTTALWPTFNPYLANGAPSPGVSSTDGNPLYWDGIYQTSNSTRRTTSIIGGEWTIIPDLVFKVTGNLYTYDYLYNYFQKSYTPINTNVLNTTRSAESSAENQTQQQYNATLQYTKAILKHHFDMLVGVETYDFVDFTSDMTGNGAPSNLIPTMNSAATKLTETTKIQEQRMVSAFFRFNYDYADKYLLTVVGREDGTSQLMNNKFGFFPGASAGWKMHEETFMKSLKPYISTLKPRISYGANGNISNIGDYSTQGAYSIGSTTYNGAIPISFTTIATPSLKWEMTKSLDAGLDMGLLNNRLSLTADYYDRRTTDLQANSNLPTYTGFSSYVTNLGTFQNKGLELSMKLNIIRDNGSGFTWDIGANASVDVNKILALPNNGVANNRQGGLYVATGPGKYQWVTPVGSYQVGGSLGDVYGYKEEKIISTDADLQSVANLYDAVAQAYGPVAYAGLVNKTGKKQITKGDVLWDDVDKNDTIDSRDEVKLGNIFPKWTGGFSSTMAYKGFSLYVFCDFSAKFLLYDDLLARTYGQYQGTFNLPTQVLNSWTTTNTNTMWPKMYYADQLAMDNITRGNAANAVINGNNSLFYQDGSYICLREVTLSYQVPSKIAHKCFLQNASLYVTGQNLWYITGYKGTSPEPAVNNNGVDQGRYPLPITCLVGVKVTL